MKKQHVVILLVAALAILGTAVAQAAPKPKITICHFPPGNPANWHTITISQNALAKHQNLHGDLIGLACEDASCDQLCSDGNVCSQDVFAESSECLCVPAPRPATDCDDSNPCTADSCQPVDDTGCVNTPQPVGWPCMDQGIAGACNEDAVCDICADVVCDPPGQCQEPGTCSDGACEYQDSPDGTYCDDGDPATMDDVCTTGECGGTVDLCFDVVCDAPGQCQEAGTCTDGACEYQDAPDSTTCDDGDSATNGDQCVSGICQGEVDLCFDVTCAPAAECQESLGCADGVCGYQNAANGTACDGGLCTDGVCTPDEEPNPECSTCVDSCAGLPIGSRWQSCETCEGYVECGFLGSLVQKSCPTGGDGNPLVWDANTGQCEATSSTCNYLPGECS